MAIPSLKYYKSCHANLPLLRLSPISANQIAGKLVGLIYIQGQVEYQLETNWLKGAKFAKFDQFRQFELANELDLYPN